MISSSWSHVSFSLQSTKEESVKKDAKLATAKEEILNQAEQLKEKLSQIEQLKENVSALENHKQRKEADLADLNSRLQTAEEKVKVLSRDLMSTTQRAESSERQVSTLQADIDAKQDEIQHLQVRIGDQSFPVVRRLTFSAGKC